MFRQHTGTAKRRCRQGDRQCHRRRLLNSDLFVTAATRESEQGAAQKRDRRAAKAAGLNYVTDQAPGIQRHKTRTGFRYVNARGKSIRDRKTLTRITSLVLPPAWEDVWISRDPHG